MRNYEFRIESYSHWKGCQIWIRMEPSISMALVWSIFLCEHYCHHAGRHLRIGQVFLTVPHRLVIIGYLPKELVSGEFEAAEIVLVVRIVLGIECIKHAYPQEDFGKNVWPERIDTRRHHDLAAGKAPAERIVEGGDL